MSIFKHIKRCQSALKKKNAMVNQLNVCKIADQLEAKPLTYSTNITNIKFTDNTL
jgi:hypothetical protein